jgi:hypothetical protein
MALYCIDLRNARNMLVVWRCKLKFVRRAMKNYKMEDTKGVIRIRKSKKNGQHITQKKKYKRTNNDLQKRFINSIE